MSISVNGIDVAIAADMSPELAAARELLRQRALALGMLDASTTDEAAIDEAIEELLAREVAAPSPTEDECRRYYEAHPQEFQSGDLVHCRHILFQVMPSVRIPEIRAQAERTLHDLLHDPGRFASVAAEFSNCPSGQQGGNLGQISRGEMVPEFEQALFRLGPTGLLRELVKTRYGFHIVMIDKHIPGEKVPFDIARDKIAERLRAVVEEKAVGQYVSILAGRARIEGVELDAAVSPLVQ
jgi:peptidyl-prolyl cis-trans isomerase C